jgi:hypothetical protein
MYVFMTDGLLQTYDSTSALIDELETGLEFPRSATLDAASGKLAVVGARNTRGIVKVIDPATSTVQEIPGKNFAVSLGFAGPLGLLAITTTDGTVRLCDTSQSLQFSLDPDRWIERACALADRELTAEEWEQYVPGDVPPTSACE